MNDAAKIADTVLLDDNGAEVRIGDLWAERPLALVFLRHFGCIFCREHAAELNDHLGEIRAVGGEVAAVGLGTPAHAAQFRQMSGIEFPLLVSEDTSVHAAAGLTRGSWLRVLGPQNIPATLRAARKGHRAKATGADMTQLGGTFVIDSDGELLWAHRAGSQGDNSSVEQIVSALRGAKATV